MAAARIDQLTDAQRDALRLVLTHHNSKEIAAILGVSSSAIDKRIERAIQVLGVATRFEAARMLDQHDRADMGASPPATAPDAASGTYERLPSEPIDLAVPPSVVSDHDQIEPWGLARRFVGLSPRGGRQGAARNRLSMGDRLIRLVGLMGLIAVTTMALVNMAMTLTSLFSRSRPAATSAHGAANAAQTGKSFDMTRHRQTTVMVTRHRISGHRISGHRISNSAGHSAGERVGRIDGAA